MRRSIIFLLLVLVGAGQLAAEDLMKMIGEGRLDDARRNIAGQSSASRRDGTLLYAQAMLEADGSNSFQFLQAAAEAALPPTLAQEEFYLSTLYFLAAERYGELADSAEVYLRRWENGKYRGVMLRMAALARSKTNQQDKSDRWYGLIIKEEPDGLYGGLARLDKFQFLYQQKKYDEARKIYRKLSGMKFEEVAVPALYLGSLMALEQNRIDDAIFDYNLLKEQYSKAIGMEDLEDRFSDIRATADNQSAEKITETIYSVQVGVFSIKANAETMVTRMKSYGQSVEKKEKIISGKKYFVVYVGRFTSSEKAMALKARLETAEKESFQVVAR
jgi:tetratricopeptide (TPR) repeat protein